MFSLYFAGGEHPGWRKHLRLHGVERLAVNFTHLAPRMPKTKEFDFSTFGPREETDDESAHPGFDLLLYTTPTELDDPSRYVELYEAFVTANADAIDVLIEPDLEGLTGRREDWADLVPEGFVPLWDGQEDLAELAGRYRAVAVTQAALEQDRVTRALLSTAWQRWQATTVALGISQPALLEQTRFDIAVSSAWTSVARRGETMVWDGTRLHRYPAKQKDEVRARHRATISRLGIDVEAVLDGDKDALTGLAIRSWLGWEASVRGRRGGQRLPLEAVLEAEEEAEPASLDDLKAFMRGQGTAQGDSTNYPDAPLEAEIVEQRPTPVGNALARRETPRVREQSILPIFGMVEPESADGSDGPPQPKIPVVVGTSLRQCDSCILQASCPQFEAGAACAFEIPVEIKTSDQLVATLQAMLEIQAQRVGFARFAEELNGGFPDPTVSAELDRFMTMTARAKDVLDTSDTLDISIKAKAGSGALSRIFGSHVGVATATLPGGGLDEADTNSLLGDILDLEPLE